MRAADALLDAACNWLALHPRIACALCVAGILMVFHMDMPR